LYYEEVKQANHNSWETLSLFRNKPFPKHYFWWYPSDQIYTVTNIIGENGKIMIMEGRAIGVIIQKCIASTLHTFFFLMGLPSMLKGF